MCLKLVLRKNFDTQFVPNSNPSQFWWGPLNINYTTDFTLLPLNLWLATRPDDAPLCYNQNIPPCTWETVRNRNKPQESGSWATVMELS